MKTVTYKEFLEFDPCWLEDEEKTKKLEEIGRRKERWTALDVLNLPEEEVNDKDKLWTVLRPEFMEEMDLHEFACWCAEDALSRVKNPDPRSLAAIEAKRKWMRGEIGDEELRKAEKDAWSATDAAEAAGATAWAAGAAAGAAADAAYAAAYNVAYNAARAAACAGTFERIIRSRQVAKLRELLEKKSIPGEKGESHYEAV